jgi:hypothetical protein
VTREARLLAAEQAIATRRARLTRRPITSIDEALALILAAVDEAARKACLATLRDRASPEVWDELCDLVQAELALCGEPVEV